MGTSSSLYMPMGIALKRWVNSRLFAPIALAVFGWISLSPVGAHAKAAGQDAGMAHYHIKVGDTLYDLAVRYLNRTDSFHIIQRLNNIDNPRRLTPGQMIRIPRSMLRQEQISAVIKSYRGTVSLQRGKMRRSAAVGLRLAEGDILETAGKSFVSLHLSDNSTVTVPSQSSIQIQRLRRTLLVDTKERLLLILKGRANVTVSPSTNSEQRFEMMTPTAVAAVRGTEFRMNFNPDDKRTTMEVVQGRVNFLSVQEGVASPAPAKLVAKGFGAATNTNSTIALLNPPKLLDPHRIQDGDQLNFTIQPIDGAALYRIQIARDAGFLDIIDEGDSSTGIIALAPLPDGTYFSRVTAIDRIGLEGMPSTYGFQRRVHRVNAHIEARQSGSSREYLFRWQAQQQAHTQYRFQLFSNSSTKPLIDEAGLQKSSFIVTNLPKGVYKWRVLSLQFTEGDSYEIWSPFQDLRIDSE